MPPWQLTWDARAATPGPHRQTLTAYDARSQSAEASQEVWVGLRLGMPGLNDGDTVGGLTMLEPEIKAPGDVTQVDYLVDGDLLRIVTAGNFSYVWEATGVNLGERTVTVRMTDKAGNEGDDLRPDSGRADCAHPYLAGGRGGRGHLGGRGRPRQVCSRRPGRGDRRIGAQSLHLGHQGDHHRSPRAGSHGLRRKGSVKPGPHGDAGGLSRWQQLGGVAGAGPRRGGRWPGSARDPPRP